MACAHRRESAGRQGGAQRTAQEEDELAKSRSDVLVSTRLTVHHHRDRSCVVPPSRPQQHRQHTIDVLDLSTCHSVWRFHRRRPAAPPHRARTHPSAIVAPRTSPSVYLRRTTTHKLEHGRLIAMTAQGFRLTSCTLCSPKSPPSPRPCARQPDGTQPPQPRSLASPRTATRPHRPHKHPRSRDRSRVRSAIRNKHREPMVRPLERAQAHELRCAECSAVPPSTLPRPHLRQLGG